MIQAAIIGISGFGRVHYADLVRYHERGALRLVGATVINPEEEQEKCATLKRLGCRLFDDYHQMLDELGDRMDLCCIPTGIGLHAPMAINAMLHGANCLIEKPAAPCIQDVHAMQAAERKTGKFVAVGYQAIYQPEVQQIKRDIVAGNIGKLKHVKGIGLWPRESGYYGRNNWAGRIRDDHGWILDSPFNNALAHYLNLCCFFAGTTFERSADLAWAQAGMYRCNPDIENTDTAILKFATTAGVDIRFYTTHCSEEKFGPVIQIVGDRGSIEWTLTQARYQVAGEAERTVPIDETTTRDRLMDALLNRISDPAQFICDLKLAGRQVLAVNGAHESSPILPADPADIERRDTENGGHRYVCRGIDTFFKNLCFGGQASTPGYAWMKMGERIPLRDYTEFMGGRTGVM